MDAGIVIIEEVPRQYSDSCHKAGEGLSYTCAEDCGAGTYDYFFPSKPGRLNIWMGMGDTF